jgi:hypothetical protein
VDVEHISSEKQDSYSNEARAISNFIYGSVFLKLGKTMRQAFLSSPKNFIPVDNRIYFAYPVPIMCYYTWMNFYEGKSLSELTERLIRDLLLLLSIRVVVGSAEKNTMFRFEKLGRNIQSNFANNPLLLQNNMKKLVKSTTMKRNALAGVWIFFLTYFYQHPVYNLDSP